MYYIHQNWERCRNRGLLESLGFPIPGSGFNGLVKARDQYPSTHERIQEAVKDLILDQDQHEGKSGAVGSRLDQFSLGSYVFVTTKPGTMHEPIEVIDYSSDEDFGLDGNEAGEVSEGPSFTGSNHREQRTLEGAVV